MNGGTADPVRFGPRAEAGLTVVFATSAMFVDNRGNPTAWVKAQHRPA
jgi:hypothetical protein